VDANVVMIDANKFVEFQATAEHNAFDDAQMDRLKTLARNGIAELLALQKKVLETA
jgi:ribonuclease PH